VVCERSGKYSRPSGGAPTGSGALRVSIGRETLESRRLAEEPKTAERSTFDGAFALLRLAPFVLIESTSTARQPTFLVPPLLVEIWRKP
jgi:hypothetical protein